MVSEGKIPKRVKWVAIPVLAWLGLMLLAVEPSAHTSNQAFVLLLPTHLYIGAGVIAVILTAILLAIPKVGAQTVLPPGYRLFAWPEKGISTLTSLGALALLLTLIGAGLTGSRDPLINPLPLFIWTVWWIGGVTLQALIGNFWGWFNPWTGMFRLFGGDEETAPMIRLPAGLGHIPALAGLLLFFAFMLAHPAPEDPALLAKIVAVYVLFTFVAMALFGGKTWLDRGEFVTVLLRNFTKMAMFATRGGSLKFGVPGWQLQNHAPLTLSAGLFVLVMLGTSSFDGLNETFRWLVLLGVNPLEFPGRSAIIWQTVGGILMFNLALVALFSATLLLGLKLIGEADQFRPSFGRFALTLMPIAVAYHIAHFFTGLSGQ